MLARFNVGANNATGEVDKAAIVAAVAAVFDGFTVIDAAGYWKGQPEKSVVVEVASLGTGAGFADKCAGLAATLALTCDQQCVGLTITDTEFMLIDRNAQQV